MPPHLQSLFSGVGVKKDSVICVAGVLVGVMEEIEVGRKLGVYYLVNVSLSG